MQHTKTILCYDVCTFCFLHLMNSVYWRTRPQMFGWVWMLLGCDDVSSLSDSPRVSTLELSTNLREVSQCPEKALTRIGPSPCWMHILAILHTMLLFKHLKLTWNWNACPQRLFKERFGSLKVLLRALWNFAKVCRPLDTHTHSTVTQIAKICR